MIVYHSFDEIPFDANTYLTIGTFDGLHSGHGSILRRLLQESQTAGARHIVCTFDPHPQIVLERPDKGPIQLLTSIQERLFLLFRGGVQQALVIPFSKEFSQIDAREFIENYLVKKVGLKKMLIGYDHSFGKNREGNDELLQELGSKYGFEVERIAPLKVQDETISSTKIRRALKEGNLDKANAMLGYPYTVLGKVVEGDGRGRKLGLPTANIESYSFQKLLPKNGVYLVSAIIDGQDLFGMANLGTRPTFTDNVNPTLEVHFFDFHKMIYGREVMISFLSYIREEQKFPTFDMFFSQIREDQATCEQLIERIRNQ